MLRRKRIVTACAALLFAVTGHAQDTSIRPFMVNVPEEAFVDLRRRLAATRWPSRETVADQSQGMQLAKLEELVRHWGTNYDWRRAEARPNAFPQFVTTIDRVDIHFIHVRSERDVSTVWIEGSKLRTGITATRTSHNREAHARVSDSSVISREGLYESR